jgi:D-alanyl-lipoteichoic acid acyltransferase DltB (MBOAT superfamily)
MALNSAAFLLLATCAVLLLPALRGWQRAALFLVLNLVFATSQWGFGALPVAMAFCLAGYICARLVRDRGAAVLASCLAILVAAFVYLRGYTSAGFLTATHQEAGVALVAFAGLSFLFFRIVHVVVDNASGTIERLSLVRYLNYCLSFPTLLMGPIQRYQDFAAQWTGEKTDEVPRTFEDCVDAGNRILRGLLKAFVLAPFIAPYALRPGLPIDTMAAGELLLKIYAFYVFLYLEFSGYCDIVIGIGTLMNLRPPENFRFPFAARNVSEYWLRVHRSLTLWLTDYIFTPLYRATIGRAGLPPSSYVAVAISLIATMAIAGAWHGTTLNFLVFGLIHGVALALVRLYEQMMVRNLGRARFRRFAETPYVTVAAVFLTYNFTSLAYTFFVLDMHESVAVFGRLLSAAFGAVA